MDSAFTFYKNTAIAAESSYPYTARYGTCKTSFTTAIPSGGVTGYKDVAGASGLTCALNHQPVSVTIEADQAILQIYVTGTIISGWGTNLDYQVNNFSGKSGGDGGYLQISTSGNVCGIISQPSHPTVSFSTPIRRSCSPRPSSTRRCCPQHTLFS